MKSNLFFSIIYTIATILICLISNTYANEDIEQKVKKLTLELRCMTCQNQSVYDSDADFSNDIKKIVKQKFEKGKSEREIKMFLVERYGEYILFRPLINYNNIFLWSFPFILLIFGLIFLVFKSRNRVWNNLFCFFVFSLYGSNINLKYFFKEETWINF